MGWWVTADVCLLIGLALLFAEIKLRQPFHKPGLLLHRCRHAPPRWQCTRLYGHPGPCAMRLSYPGRFVYHLRQLRYWPGRLLRRYARRWLESQIRCPSCGKREAPRVIEPCRHCGYFSPF